MQPGRRGHPSNLCHWEDNLRRVAKLVVFGALSSPPVPLSRLLLACCKIKGGLPGPGRPKFLACGTRPQQHQAPNPETNHHPQALNQSSLSSTCAPWRTPSAQVSLLPIFPRYSITQPRTLFSSITLFSYCRLLLLGLLHSLQSLRGERQEQREFVTRNLGRSASISFSGPVK